MIGFEPTEEQRLIVENVSAFARDRLRPAARENEALRRVRDDLVREAHDLGLTTLELPADVGGGGLGLLDAVLVEESLGWGDPAVALGLSGPHALASLVRELGDSALLAEYAGDSSRVGAFAWSEPTPCERAGFASAATRDGDHWILNGAKRHVLNADRATTLALAVQIDPSLGWNGLGIFLVDRRAEGLSVGARSATLGLDAASFCAVRFDNLRVADAARLGDGDITAPLLRAFQRVSLRNAARCVGLGRASVELALAYSQDRVAFGKPVAHFQAIAFALADRHMEVESASLLVQRAAAEWDAGRYDPGAVAGACAYAQRVAVTAADTAVQIHGGAGFMRDYLPEKLLRDARTLALYAVSPATGDQVLAAHELGVALDGALALPTSDIQPVFV